MNNQEDGKSTIKNKLIEKTSICDADDDSEGNLSDVPSSSTTISQGKGRATTKKKSVIGKIYVADEDAGRHLSDTSSELLEAFADPEPDIPQAGYSKDLVPKAYVHLGNQVLISMEKKIDILMNEKKWPKEGWSDHSIELVLNQIAAIDSNNFESKSCIGEREGRIFSDLVARRHYRMAHGIGRSGDLTELQPKAGGSSMLYRLTNALVLDACRTLVSKDVKHAFVSPMATGMSIGLVLLTLKKKNPSGKYVIWPRLDQKSCLKSIITCGLIPLVVEGIKVENEIQTNVDEIRNVLEANQSTVLCVLSSTSCFAPRVRDSVKEIAELCKLANTPHVINNAYGLQARQCTTEIANAHKCGRVDFFVQSTDKNFMVPVGGAIIAGFDKSIVEEVAASYPGRASAAPILDVFITLLSMGSKKYTELQKTRTSRFKILQTELGAVAAEFSEQVISSPRNPISIGITLTQFGNNLPEGLRLSRLTMLGSMLFTRHVFGARVVTGKESKIIDGFEFNGWGAHCSSYPDPYLTVAASIGIEEEDITKFIKTLRQCLHELKRKEMAAQAAVAVVDLEP